MRYSNVSESFLSFISGQTRSEEKSISDRIHQFLVKNRQFGYEMTTKMPGLVPLERISQDIAVSERTLRRFIRNGKYPNARLIKVNSVVWDGDVIAFTAPESKSSGYASYSGGISNYNDSGYRGRRSSDGSDYGDIYRGYHRRGYGIGNRRYKSPMIDESILSDFGNYIRSFVDKSQHAEYDFDDALGRVLYFLSINPDYDYHKLSDTPGLIFVSTLSEYTKVPYKVLVELFKNSPIPNSTVIRFKSRDIDGPVVIFGRPDMSRRDAYNVWKSEGDEQYDEIHADSDHDDERVVRSDFEGKSSTEDVPDEDEQMELGKAYEISAEEKTRRFNALVKETNTHMRALLEGFNRDKIKSPNQALLIDYYEDATDKVRESAIHDALEAFMNKNSAFSKHKELLGTVFQESENTPGEFYIMEDVSAASLKLAAFLWNDAPKFFVEKLQS